jgi:hypothetical protein
LLIYLICRDLIACTDNIIDISTKCHNILSNISVIQVRGCVTIHPATGSRPNSDLMLPCHVISLNPDITSWALGFCLQESFSTLAVSVTSSSGSGADGKESARKHQELHGKQQGAATINVVWRFQLLRTLYGRHQSDAGFFLEHCFCSQHI